MKWLMLFVVANIDLCKETKQATSHIESFIEWYICETRRRNFALKKSKATGKQTRVSEFFQNFEYSINNQNRNRNYILC